MWYNYIRIKTRISKGYKLMDKPFVTRFVTRKKDSSGNGEELYYYNTKEEALAHLALFRNDDSALYENITVMDVKTTTVLALLMFDENGKESLYVEDGWFARLRPEYRKPEEARNVYLIRNINEVMKRCTITSLTSSMVLKPSETVGLEMVMVYPSEADAEKA